MDSQLSTTNKPTVYFASDHAGFELKNALLAYVRDELGCDTEDCGAFELDEKDDYPDFIRKAAAAVAKAPDDARGVVLGGSGQGEAMAANRYAGVRAAVFYGGSHDLVRLAREHNDANVLSLGARFVDEADAKEAVRLFLSTPFSGEERHARRIHKLDARPE
jgi:ribose 5-phosphate isomerase B